MQYSMNIVILAAASLASATNLVTFVSMDSTSRTIVWTGDSEIENTSVPGKQNVTITVPDSWIGNAYSVSEGSDLGTPGMLAEFAWNSYAGATYFDVSAIVNPDDTEGVYQMYPADGATPVSGCETFKCSNAYYQSDDVQTKSTDSTHIIVTLGAGTQTIAQRDLEGREADNFPHDAVMKRSWTPAIKGRFTYAQRWANSKN